MAPVEKRDLETEEQQEEVKRAKLDESKEEEKEEVEEGDEEEDPDLDDDEDDDDEEDYDEMDDDAEFDMIGPDSAPYFEADQFEGVEVTEDQLEKFSESYNEWIEKLNDKCEKDELNPMLLTKPQSIRPVPQTTEDFEKGMVVAYLSNKINAEKDRIAEEFDKANELDADDEDVQDEGDEAKMEEAAKKIGELLKKASASAVKTVLTELDSIDGKMSESMAEASEHLLILTDMVFDTEIHHMFSEHADEEAATKMLNRLAASWKSVLKATPEETNTVDTRTGIINFIESCIDDLKKGEFADEEEQNKFANVTFDFMPTA